MIVTRRELLAMLSAAGFRMQHARAGAPEDVPRARSARVEALYKSPDGHPNALETTQEGLWVGEQVTDAAYLLDWRTGKVLRRIETESSNTSGIAYGGGYLWMGANGKATHRPARPTDAAAGEIVKINATTGKTEMRFPVPGGGGVHGLLWAKDSLWITTLRRKTITQLDANGRELHSFPVTLDRAHGLGWDGKAIWCMFSTDYAIHRLDPSDGRILEVVQLARTDPDPHGMTWHNGILYYCDAGIAPGGKDNGSKYAGYICRIHF